MITDDNIDYEAVWFDLNLISEISGIDALYPLMRHAVLTKIRFRPKTLCLYKGGAYKLYKHSEKQVMPELSNKE